MIETIQDWQCILLCIAVGSAGLAVGLFRDRGFAKIYFRLPFAVVTSSYLILFLCMGDAQAYKQIDLWGLFSVIAGVVFLFYMLAFGNFGPRDKD